jgi:hypothetical protein
MVYETKCIICKTSRILITMIFLINNSIIPSFYSESYFDNNFELAPS